MPLLKSSIYYNGILLLNFYKITINFIKCFNNLFIIYIKYCIKTMVRFFTAAILMYDNFNAYGIIKLNKMAIE